MSFQSEAKDTFYPILLYLPNPTVSPLSFCIPPILLYPPASLALRLPRLITFMNFQYSRIDTVVTEGSEDAGDGAKNTRESAQETEYVVSGSESSGEERSQVSRPSVRSKGWMKYWEILEEDKAPIDPMVKAKFSNLSSISEILKEKPTLICPHKVSHLKELN